MIINGVERRIEPRTDLREADIHGADLHGANLRVANLRGAILHGANLRVADLRGADLGGANLRGADLGGADLGGVDLRGADLRGADLRGAILHGADLLNLDGAIDLGTPYSWRVVLILHDPEPLIFAGCQRFTLSQAHDHWGLRSDRTRMLPLLAYAEALIKNGELS